MKLLIYKHVVRVGFSVACDTQVADTCDNPHYLFQGTFERGDHWASRWRIASNVGCAFRVLLYSSTDPGASVNSRVRVKQTMMIVIILIPLVTTRMREKFLTCPVEMFYFPTICRKASNFRCCFMWIWKLSIIVTQKCKLTMYEIIGVTECLDVIRYVKDYC
jgi:hypothetical protein